MVQGSHWIWISGHFCCWAHFSPKAFTWPNVKVEQTPSLGTPQCHLSRIIPECSESSQCPVHTQSYQRQRECHQATQARIIQYPYARSQISQEYIRECIQELFVGPKKPFVTKCLSQVFGSCHILSRATNYWHFLRALLWAKQHLQVYLQRTTKAEDARDRKTSIRGCFIHLWCFLKTIACCNRTKSSKTVPSIVLFCIHIWVIHFQKDFTERPLLLSPW